VTTDHQVASLFFVKRLGRGPAGYGLRQPSQEAKHSLTGITHTRRNCREEDMCGRVSDDLLVSMNFDTYESLAFHLPHGG
jgi:hypothetical protein